MVYKVFASLIFSFAITHTIAQAAPPANISGTDTGSNKDKGAKIIEIENPIGNKKPNVNVIIGGIIQIVLGIVGSLALAMFVYGGVVLMVSAGNQDKVQKGKDVLIWATVGLIVVFTAYAAVAFVIEGFTIGV